LIYEGGGVGYILARLYELGMYRGGGGRCGIVCFI
jgi:hypothetical protein